LRYKQNYIKKKFGGDEAAYKLYLATKVKELYHDPNKNYKKVSDKRRSDTYYRGQGHNTTKTPPKKITITVTEYQTLGMIFEGRVFR